MDTISTRAGRICLSFLGIYLAFWVGGLYGVSGRVQAAPSALNCQTVALTAPASGSVLSGAVEIRGRALVTGFQFYKVEDSAQGQGKWTLIGADVVRKPVSEGRLVVWQTTLVQNGSYRLRLHVVDSTGNYCEVVAGPFRVSNAFPTVVELPTLTETVPEAVVPVQSTPTIVVSVPVEVAPNPTVLTTPLPARTIGVKGINLTVLTAFFLFGVMAMLAVAMFVGAIMLVRRRG
ncbi:MAG: hypothetical protein M1570_10195 [Chloroflexi bacterium]|nr:hypothetical protein [Chloroflexota bacterium]